MLTQEILPSQNQLKNNKHRASTSWSDELIYNPNLFFLQADNTLASFRMQVPDFIKGQYWPGELQDR
jgi:hypothetical protein